MVEPSRKDVLHHLAVTKSWERNVAAFATVVLFPGAFAFLGAFTPDIRKDYPNALIWVWLFLIVIFILFAWRFNPADQTAISLIVQNEEFENSIEDLTGTIEELHKAIDLLVLQSDFSISARAIILEYTIKNITTVQAFQRLCSELAAPLYLQGEFIFDFGSSELWNFAIYLYSKDDNILKPIWRQKATNHPSTGMGRSWKRGEGHVGKAFVDRRAIITEDARKGEASEFSTVPPGREEAYDKNVYVSFAAVPIGPVLSQDDRPYGVVVGTSDRPGRFDREKAGILVHVASAIAAALITGKLNVDTLSVLSSPVASTEERPNG